MENNEQRVDDHYEGILDMVGRTEDKKLHSKRRMALKKYTPKVYEIKRPYEVITNINVNIRIDNTPFYKRFDKYKHKKNKRKCTQTKSYRR